MCWCSNKASNSSGDRRAVGSRYSVQINRAMPRRQRRATSRRAEGPRDTTACRETMRCHVVQRACATSRRTEGPLDVTCCGETARCHLVQRDRATSRRTEGLCDATEKPRDAMWCRETARRYSAQRKIVQIEVVLRPRRRPIDHRRFGPASGQTGHALPVPPHTRRRRTDSEYAECSRWRKLIKDV